MIGNDGTRRAPGVFFAAGGWLVLVGAAHAASPALSTIRPAGVQRGGETEIVLSGARLTDATQLVFFAPGVTCVEFKVINDNQIKAKLKAAPECRLGEYALRVLTKSGLSDLRNFFVGALPIVQEKEPNSEFSQPQDVPLNCTVVGTVDSEDIDYFRVVCKKGQRLTAEVEGLRLGYYFDPHLSILDAKRFTLAASDDHPLLNQDASCGVVVPQDGAYLVAVRESSFRGDGNCHYRLHIGTFPRPTGIYPPGGPAGQKVAFTFLGDAKGPMPHEALLPATMRGERLPLFAQDAEGIAPSPNWIRASPFPNVMEQEPNDDAAHATKTVLPLPLAFNGIIDKPGDRDFFRFKATKGQVFDVQVYARRLRSPLDSVLHIIRASNGQYLAGDDDARGKDSFIRWTVPETDDYFIHVHDHLLKGGPDYVYRVEFQPVKPQLSVQVPEFQQFTQDRRVIAVPRGNRMFSLLQANRQDFGGELSFGFQDLPKGVAAAPVNMHPGMDRSPVLFEAAADAPLGVALAGVTAKHIDPKTGIAGDYETGVPLVYGEPNNTVYWQHTVNKLAVAVVEEIPFKVSLVPPKIPLAHDGNLNVKILVERKPGFAAPVTVFNYFNPPNVGSVGVVTIPGNQSEGTMSFNANRNAEVRSWKIGVQATADVGKGPMWCGTPFADLKIAAPYAEMQLQMATAEQGKPAEMVCKVDPKAAWQGDATATLVGYPAHIKVAPLKLSKNAKELVFKLDIGKEAPVGKHASLFVQLLVPENGDLIQHNLAYGGTLRIDAPPPPKKDAPPAPVAKPAAQPPPVAAAPPKRLTRLEQLRLEQSEKAKAEKK